VNAETIWLFLMIQAGMVFVLAVGWRTRRSKLAGQSTSAARRDRSLLVIGLPVGLILWQVLAFSILFSGT
jgi:hypothetical protein